MAMGQTTATTPWQALKNDPFKYCDPENYPIVDGNRTAPWSLVSSLDSARIRTFMMHIFERQVTFLANPEMAPWPFKFRKITSRKGTIQEAIYNSDWMLGYVDKHGRYITEEDLVPIPPRKRSTRGVSLTTQSSSVATTSTAGARPVDDDELGIDSLPDSLFGISDPEDSADPTDGLDHPYIGEQNGSEEDGNNGVVDTDQPRELEGDSDLVPWAIRDAAAAPLRNMSPSSSIGSSSPPPSTVPSSGRSTATPAPMPQALPTIMEDTLSNPFEELAADPVPESPDNPFATLAAMGDFSENLATKSPSWAGDSMERRMKFLRSLSVDTAFQDILGWLDTQQVCLRCPMPLWHKTFTVVTDYIIVLAPICTFSMVSLG